MDFVRAMSFPFDDDDWIVKFVVGTLMTLVGFVLPFIPLGYQINVARKVMRHNSRPLPGTDEIGQVVADGLMGFVGGLIYALPAILVSCVFFVPMAVMDDSGVGGFLLICLWLCVTGIMIVYGVVAAALYWMGVIRYAETGNFSEFMRFGELWYDVRQNIGTLVMLLVYGIVLLLIMSIVVPIASFTCIGLPVAVFYSQVVTGHLVGQAGLEVTGA